MYSAKTRKYLLLLLILGWAITLAYKYFSYQINKQPEQLYHNNRILMGTFWEVTSPDKQASAIVFAEVERLEQLFSKYKEDSEISRLNRTGELKVSLDTFQIIKKSKEFYQLTDGAFDITVSPLVELWGFTKQKPEVPNDEKIKSALLLVGSDKIILHEKDSVVEFKLSGMKIDLGGIAKGYALDCAVKKLKENNIASCLINAGGQVYALGDKFAKPWKIAIKNPRKSGVLETLVLLNQSASTSGDYEQFFWKNGKRYAHIINPKTGYPVDSLIHSITIIANNGITADALSTAIFVLGKTKGEELLKKIPKTRIIIF